VSQSIQQSNAIVHDFGDGLVMRRAAPADADRLGEFNAMVHGDNPRDAAGVAAWTRDLLLLPHPTFKPEDFLLVEDIASGKVVSSLNLISQTWTYEGIPFKVGRPELVGTDPAYRKRGLVRRQFEEIHRWSAERGELVQVITGIPNFYRQYGYEMGLNLGGGRSGYEPQLPKLKDGESEPYRVRTAGLEDLPWLAQMYARETRYSMVNAVFDEDLLRYEIGGKSQDNVNRWVPCVIEAADGRPVGYLVHPSSVWGTSMAATRYALAEGESYLAVTPSVVRYLWEIGQAGAAEWERKLEAFTFGLGAEHPVYRAFGDRLPRERKPYAFYVRVPELPAFLRLIAPVLEQRMRDSVCAGHSGEMKISFYRSGLRLVFEKGALVTAEDWCPIIKDDEGSAAFPDLTFLQLVFGYRGLAELRSAYADCTASSDTHVILDALFPRKPSNVWAVS
jgi:hypothetical protein